MCLHIRDKILHTEPRNGRRGGSMTPKGPTESRIQAQVRAVLSHREADTRVWRNNVGKGHLAARECGYCKIHGSWVQWGLQVGSSDLIGIHRCLITEDMVGSVIGKFFGVEIKTPVGRLQKEQKIWIQTIENFGGIAEVCRSDDEARALLARLSP